MMNPRELLLGSFRAALAAADPLAIVPAHLPAAPPGRTLVVGAGNAAAAMAAAVEAHWPAQAPLEGVVITRYGHGLPTQRIRVVEAGHPVPDEAGEAASAFLGPLREAIDFEMTSKPSCASTSNSNLLPSTSTSFTFAVTANPTG